MEITSFSVIVVIATKPIKQRSIFLNNQILYVCFSRKHIAVRNLKSWSPWEFINNETDVFALSGSSYIAKVLGFCDLMYA